MSHRIQTLSEYTQEYQKSILHPEKFWDTIAHSFDWRKPWTKTLEWNFETPKIHWFINGKLNITENILDRHLSSKKDHPAIIWEPNDPDEKHRIISYLELYEMTCRFSNTLVENGIEKGDRIIIYMPMVPEATVAMLACARIGAIHSVVFAGFSSSSLAERIKDCNAKMVLTSDGNFRGKKRIPIKEIVDEALKKTSTIEKMIVLKRTGRLLNPFQQL